MTKTANFDAIISALATSDIADDLRKELIDFCKKEQSLIANRASHKTPTKNQKENEGLKDIIVELVAASDEGLSISDMLTDERLASYKSQKISALLTQLRKNGKIRRFYVKKTPYFAIGDETAEESEE